MRLVLYQKLKVRIEKVSLKQKSRKVLKLDFSKILYTVLSVLYKFRCFKTRRFNFIIFNYLKQCTYVLHYVIRRNYVHCTLYTVGLNSIKEGDCPHPSCVAVPVYSIV